MMLSQWIALILIILQSINQSINAFTVSNTISSHMVLHASPQSARLYGWSTPQSIITAVIDQSTNQSTTYRTFTREDGRWFIELDPQPISTNRSIDLSSTGSTTKISLIDVSFGHVYLCGGQSNMMFVLSESFDGPQSINQSINQSMIRLFSVAETLSEKIENDVPSNFADGEKWVRPSPKYVGGPLWTYFSAVCWYFGVSLSASLNHTVPIGLIASTVGGTRIEAWTSTAGLESCGPVVPMFKPSINAPINLNNASLLYNAMIAPLYPVRLTAVLWYQGEQNYMNSTNYNCRFPAMINDWRRLFDHSHLFFNFVLLAAYHNSRWPEMRQVQMNVLSSLPYTGVAAPIDAGDEASPIGGIHSRNKTIVGQRLAAVVLNQVYNQHVIDQGPSHVDVVWPINALDHSAQSTNQSIHQSINQSIVIRYSPSSRYSQGLTLLSTPNCTEAAGGCCDSIGGSPIVLVDDKGETSNALVTLLPSAYLIIATASTSLQRIRTVLFNWQSYPGCVLYNEALMPQLPFNATRV